MFDVIFRRSTMDRSSFYCRSWREVRKKIREYQADGWTLTYCHRVPSRPGFWLDTRRLEGMGRRLRLGWSR